MNAICSTFSSTMHSLAGRGIVGRDDEESIGGARVLVDGVEPRIVDTACVAETRAASDARLEILIGHTNNARLRTPFRRFSQGLPDQATEVA